MKGWMNHDYTHCLDYTPQGYAGYVAVLERAIELLKGETDERKAESKEV